MNEQQQFDFLDIITVFTAIIQVVDHTLLVEQASNDDILRELRKDMEELRMQNKKILSMLAKIKTGMENNMP